MDSMIWIQTNYLKVASFVYYMYAKSIGDSVVIDLQAVKAIIGVRLSRISMINLINCHPRHFIQKSLEFFNIPLIKIG